MSRSAPKKAPQRTGAAAPPATAASPAGDNAFSFGGAEGALNLSTRPSFTKQAPKKGLKVAIKMSNVAATLPPDFFQKMWGKLEIALHAIHNQSPVEFPLEDLYGAVRDLCLNNCSNALYERLETACESHCASVLHQLANVQLSGADFLVKVAATWDTICLELRQIRAVFNVLDREVILQAAKRPIWDMGVERFREHFCSQQVLKDKCIAGVVDLIHEERKGASVDTILVKTITSMLKDIKLYDTFEPKMIQSATTFFKEEAAKTAQKDDAIRQYNNLVQGYLSAEKTRADTYLTKHSKKSLINSIEVHMIAEPAADIVNNGFAYLLSRNLHADLALMHTHFSYANVQKLPLMLKAFREYIIVRGKQRVSDASADASLIEDLLALKKTIDEVVATAFAKELPFVTCTRDSLEHVLSIRGEKPAHLLAKHIDTTMRSGNKESEENIEMFLDSCLDLLRLIKAKDSFEAFYSKDFAKRLLFNRSAGKDIEQLFIGKLKAECGPSFTQKLEGMLTDLDVSQDLALAYKNEAVDQSLQVTVLTGQHWPKYPTCDVLLPVKMKNSLKEFEKFYLGKHKGRKVEWNTCLCTCTVKAVMAKWKKELIVSLLQALVLLAFNDVEECSFADICAKLGTKDAELTRAIQHLTFSQNRILKRKVKGGKEIAETDVFKINEDFQHKNYRVRMNLMMKDSDQETKATTEKVVEDRKHSIDACIVRTMKSRKILSHAELISVVLAQLNFPTQPADLKKRVEFLIEREYLTRDEDKQNIYHYVA